MFNLVLLLLTFALVSFDPPGCVTICHKPGTPAEQTKCVPPGAVAGHLGHGDYLGACSAKAVPTELPRSTSMPIPTYTPGEPPPTKKPIGPTSTSSIPAATSTSFTPEETPNPTGPPPMFLPVGGGPVSLPAALAILIAGSGLVLFGRFLRRK